MDLRHYKADGTLKDGRIVHVRAIRLDDKAALLAGFQRLSGKSAYMRFMSPKNEITTQELAYYTEIDYVRHLALVATLEENEGQQLIGSGRYIAYDEPGPPHRAELAFAVEDNFQGLGVATLVLKHLVKIARGVGIRELRADVLPQNTAMLRVFEKSGLPLRRIVESGTTHISLTLPNE